MPSSSQECRRQAQALIGLAEASASPREKRRLANLAEAWLKLAGDLEQLDRQLQSRPTGKRPASGTRA